MSDDYEVLAKSSMFAGVPVDEIPLLLKSAQAEVRSWKRGETIREAGDEMDFFGIVLSGSIQATLPQSGRMLLVGRFEAGDSFAEAAPVALKRTPVSIMAAEDARVICVNPDLLGASPNPYAPVMQANLTTEMSKKLLHLSSRLSILNEPRLRNRILMYLKNQPKQPDDSVALSMSYRELADYLGVNSAALSRELGRMQDEGIVRVDKHSITVLPDAGERED